MYSLNSEISPASKNRALIHHESVKSLKHGQSFISSPSHGYCDKFFVGNFFESFWFSAMAVFILEDALSVRTDNASTAVFILRMHYPTGQTWAKI